ncbi:MAG: biotin-dependent carboxyltransferase family protein [Acidimicrobiia bacterium]
MTALHVVEPGPLTLVEDLGRPGLAAQGVGRSGAADVGAHALAQRLCGNDPSAAGLEVLVGGLVLRTGSSLVLAVTGARVGLLVDGVPRGTDHALHVDAGVEVRLTPATIGVRAYVAVRGGIAVPPVLGSRSRDTLGGIGPPPLQAGDALPVGDLGRDEAWLEPVPVVPPADELTLHLAPGPHDDVLGGDGWDQLRQVVWRVDPRSDRIGVRLAGPALPVRAVDLPSLPVVPGCVQLPGDGRPVILGPDAGVTGGYPVLGVLDQAGLDALMQARPGAALRLRPRGR